MSVPTPADSAATDVIAYFDTLRTRHPDTQIRGLTGICRFDIQSVGSWLVVVNDGYVDVRQSDEVADSEVRCAARELLDVVRGGQNAFTAALQGKLRISGHLALIQLLERIAM